MRANIYYLTKIVIMLRRIVSIDLSLSENKINRTDAVPSQKQSKGLST